MNRRTYGWFGTDRRKELRAQKRKLVTEELRKCQKLQPNRLLSNTDENDVMGYHGPLFSRILGLMPERDRLASSLFTVAPIRSDEGRAVLRDIISLYQQDIEGSISPRPGAREVLLLESLEYRVIVCAA
jgi:hypothetical protein